MNILDLIKASEGWRSRAYRDSRGILTSGYGFNLETEDMPREVGELWLQIRAAIAVDDASHLFPTATWAALTPARQAALVDLAYNLGGPGLIKFHVTLSAIEAGNWQAAHDALLDSKAYQEEPQRIQRDAMMLLYGTWPDEWATA